MKTIFVYCTSWVAIWQSPVPTVTGGWLPRDKSVDLECQYYLRAPGVSSLQELEDRNELRYLGSEFGLVYHGHAEFPGR